MGSGGSDIKRAERHAGVGGVLGHLLGRSHGRMSWPARNAGLACGLSRPSWTARPSSSPFSFSILFFLLLYLNSILILEFEFKIGVPYWSFRYDAHIIVIYIRNLFSYFV